MGRWLDKNRDPVNDTVIDLFKKSTRCALLNECLVDHPGQTKEEEGKFTTFDSVVIYEFYI